MSDFSITREESGSKGRYSLERDGHRAELTYSRLGATQVIADHTEVDDALRGTGAGLALAERLVADARAEGFRIIPLCPFVNAQRRKHPDWADVFQV
ncbi:GNAT family N-acetyltransferase [Marinovum sp. 2_MG-2023]|uniref:GNAT family N-acetyltransferase n=1 Tax=unclassified Marinovum TaxID=2647166 RepID=UPI0026E209F1|nr:MULTISPECIES: GNAT family N-acetyltransferase [unclassified Marinovum]MDO6731668.1 GNAT family N-acetyltransferase [Marinovum sp. 2_MG-2023]MDO6780920.1 GNAT family N-acetyltransferase [Marinovum sp. 1_MG-2023]